MLLPNYPKTIALLSKKDAQRKHGIFFEELLNQPVVVEEKLDGSHCGVGFNSQAELVVFSRHTELEPEALPADFQLLYRQCSEWLDELFDVLGDRYMLYGEWMYATHHVYYDRLPAYFMEDDCFDRERACFLSTSKRAEVLQALPPPFRHSVPVLSTTTFSSFADFQELLQPSLFSSTKTPSEGLYVKWEEQGEVKGRYKWVRPSFLDGVVANTHWRKKTQRRNLLDADALCSF